MNSGDPPEIVPEFVEDQQIPYPVVLDDGLTEHYDVVAYPTHIVLDRSGRIRHREVGGDPAGVGTLRAILTELLAESSG